LDGLSVGRRIDFRGAKSPQVDELSESGVQSPIRVVGKQKGAPQNPGSMVGNRNEGRRVVPIEAADPAIFVPIGELIVNGRKGTLEFPPERLRTDLSPVRHRIVSAHCRALKTVDFPIDVNDRNESGEDTQNDNSDDPE
jgi:hypothetical protein